MSKEKKGFYDILWLMCEKDNLIIKWVADGYLIRSKNTYYWTPKAMVEFNCISVGELPFTEQIELSQHSLESSSESPLEKSDDISNSIRFGSRTKKTQSDEELTEKINNSLEEFINLFSSKNIGIAGKTTGKVTVVKKLLKFFSEYPDYTMNDVIEATKIYIATLKKQGSIRFIRECGYFISKRIEGVDQSDLAKWCEEYKSGGQSYTDYSSHNLL